MTSLKINTSVDMGAVIRKRRKSLRLRIDDAASMCGIAVSTLSAMENGTRPVGLDKLLPVLFGLGIDLVASFQEE